MSWIEIPARSVYGDLDLGSLEVDEGFLNITTDSPFTLYSLSDECYRCPFIIQKQIDSSEFLKVNTKYGQTWRLYEGRTSSEIPFDDRSSMLCEVRAKQFGEFGIYNLYLEESKCQIETALPPVNIYLPLFLIVVGLLTAALLYLFINYLCNKFSKDGQESPRSKRVVSVDTFRGISIGLMIFVNYGGGEYWFLDHAVWNGLNVADLVFPWFMWIMGVCIPISIGSQLKNNTNRLVILRGILRRSLILFLLGLALNTQSGADLNTIRIMGVLQRFSIVYFIVATIVTLLSFKSTFKNKEDTDVSKSPFSDVVHILPQWIVVLLFFAAHCYLTFFFPVPGCKKGYLGPGGIQYDGRYQNCTGGAAGYVDRLILRTSHLYQHPTAQDFYLNGPFDPEGLVGCLTSIFQVFLGAQAGFTLTRFKRYHRRIISRWLIWGTVFGIMGLVLCQARRDGGWIPINKNLWSFSYVCVTSSLAFYLLTLLYVLIDVQKYWNGAPFVYPGMNATILYVGHSVANSMFPWHWSLGPMNTHFIKTIEALWGTSLWFLIAYWLFTIKFFLSL